MNPIEGDGILFILGCATFSYQLLKNECLNHVWFVENPLNFFPYFFHNQLAYSVCVVLA